MGQGGGGNIKHALSRPRFKKTKSACATRAAGANAVNLCHYKIFFKLPVYLKLFAFPSQYMCV